MKVTETAFKGLLVLDPSVFYDDRGYFFELYNVQRFEDVLNVNFLQDNVSRSKKNVLRGLHFQNPPYAQGKLVTVLNGSVLDVVVDLRQAEPTYGQSYKILLDDKEKKMLYVPEGFAHGFLTLEENTIFSYKCTNVYNKESEGGLNWDDPFLKIEWPVKDPIVSDKDKIYPSFQCFNSLF